MTEIYLIGRVEEIAELGFVCENHGRGKIVVYKTDEAENRVELTEDDKEIIANRLWNMGEFRNFDRDYKDSFIGDGVATDFTLANYPCCSESTRVYVGGVLQYLEDDYSIITVTNPYDTLRFLTVPAETVEIIITYATRRF